MANARLAYAAYEEVFGSERFDRARAMPAPTPSVRCGPRPASRTQRYPDTMYVTDLVVADTVNTMPEKTLEAFADHGEVSGDQVTGRAADARGRVRPARPTSASTSTT